MSEPQGIEALDPPASHDYTDPPPLYPWYPPYSAGDRLVDRVADAEDWLCDVERCEPNDPQLTGDPLPWTVWYQRAYTMSANVDDYGVGRTVRPLLTPEQAWEKFLMSPPARTQVDALITGQARPTPRGAAVVDGDRLAELIVKLAPHVSVHAAKWGEVADLDLRADRDDNAGYRAMRDQWVAEIAALLGGQIRLDGTR